MTPDRLREIRERLDAATPGGAWVYVLGASYMLTDDIPSIQIACEGRNDPVIHGATYQDLQLMAQAHRIISELLTEVERFHAQSEPETALHGVVRRYLSDAQFRQQVEALR